MTVVYGRLAGDNEIIAVKTAGVSVMRILWPTFHLAIVLSLVLLFLSGSWIPQCTHLAKLVLFKDVEDTFYKWLKKDHEFNNPRWPFLIKVPDVKDKVMIEPTFKHRVHGAGRLRPGDPGQEGSAAHRPRRQARPRLLRSTPRSSITATTRTSC